MAIKLKYKQIIIKVRSLQSKRQKENLIHIAKHDALKKDLQG